MTTADYMDYKDAGSFSEWLKSVSRSLATGEGIDVDCGDCRACCTSSYFVHIGPDDSRALSRIPQQLLFPAPGMAAGNFILGYDEHGRCPMFKGNSCSIYSGRPSTCRNFDCRILTATGITEIEEKQLINREADRWRFSLEDKDDHDALAALKTAARFILENEKEFPAGFVPKNAVQRAVLAVKVYKVFIGLTGEPGSSCSGEQRRRLVQAVVDACREF